MVTSIINGRNVEKNDSSFQKFDPSNGKLLYEVSNPTNEEIQKAIKISNQAQKSWSKVSPVNRGELLDKFLDLIALNKTKIIKTNAIETGKSLKDSEGEFNGSFRLGKYFSGEGMRLYSTNAPSINQNKIINTIREPMGTALLIVPANTALANIFWKIFPALICGNSVILKASEDAPMLAQIIGELFISIPEFPKGLFSVIQGDSNTSSFLLSQNGIDIVSFTGSTEVGKKIGESCGKRLIKCSLELGGKNPMVICKDAEISNALKWTLLSGFSNAGQRCAAASRIFIHENIYESFKQKLIIETKKLKIGVANDCFLGPLINQRGIVKAISALNQALKEGGKILCGDNNLEETKNSQNNTGFYFNPTIIENISPESDLSKIEFFAPIILIYKFSSLEEVIHLANTSDHGLTSSIHTQDINTALNFIRECQVGLVNVNIGTYGSEPQMAFGGYKDSGNGTREPGLQSLDVYSQLKTYTFNL